VARANILKQVKTANGWRNIALVTMAPRRLLLHGENDQFDGERQIQIAGLRFISPMPREGAAPADG
jgi:hypothetical protein